MRGDPLEDFDDWDLKNYEWLRKRPECCMCGQPIQEEYGYVIENGWFCEDCVKKEFRKWIEEDK